MNRVEQYAIDLAVNAIQSSAEDDLDEDGRLNHPSPCDHIGLCPDHEMALELASNISKWIEENPEEMLRLIRET